MPPKKKEGANEPKRRRKAPAPPLDFRAALIFFKGELTGKNWFGTWVAWVPTEDQPAPEHEHFAQSPFTFNLWFDSSVKKQKSTWKNGVGVAGAEVDMGSASVTAGSFKLDIGKGVKDFSDHEHHCHFCHGPPMVSPAGDCEWGLAAAVGSNDFGKFVSLGRLEGRPGHWNLLTLARRYITDDDPRCAMTAEEVLARVNAYANGPEMWACDAPWEGLPYKAPDHWPGGIREDLDIAGAHIEVLKKCVWSQNGWTKEEMEVLEHKTKTETWQLPHIMDDADEDEEQYHGTWQEFQDSQGRTYYYNPDEARSVWELPEGAQLSTYKCPEHLEWTLKIGREKKAPFSGPKHAKKGVPKEKKKGSKSNYAAAMDTSS